MLPCAADILIRCAAPLRRVAQKAYDAFRWFFKNRRCNAAPQRSPFCAAIAPLRNSGQFVVICYMLRALDVDMVA